MTVLSRFSTAKGLAMLLVALMTLAVLPLATASAQGDETETPPAPPTIAEIAIATPELSTLVTALTVATEAGPVDF